MAKTQGLRRINDEENKIEYYVKDNNFHKETSKNWKEDITYADSKFLMFFKGNFGVRRFSLRGLEKVNVEWGLTQNYLHSQRKGM